MSKNDTPTVACPICTGPLTPAGDKWECEVGHVFSFPAVAECQVDAVVRALWASLRALEDRAIAGKYSAQAYESAGRPIEAERVRSDRSKDLEMAELLHGLLARVDRTAVRLQGEAGSSSDDDAPDQGSHS